MRADTSVLSHYLEPLVRPLAETGVTEVVVNRPREIGIEAAGGWTWREDPRLSPEWLMTLETAAAAFTSQDVTPETPICSTVLPGGASVARSSCRRRRRRARSPSQGHAIERAENYAKKKA